MHSFNQSWVGLIADLLHTGQEVTVRGQQTLELSGQVTVRADRPILTVPERRLGYRFMCAEAAWILSGDDRVSQIKPFSRDISNFSDNGETFFGAYGPKLIDQWAACRDKLLADPFTRQAVINIWRENPPETKDTPCTLSYQFLFRDGALHMAATMRSSDVWLGLPYDIFNQSMMIHAMIATLLDHGWSNLILPGRVLLTSPSLHLYDRNYASAREVLKTTATRPVPLNDDLPPINFVGMSMPQIIADLWNTASFETDSAAIKDPTLRAIKEQRIDAPKDA